MLMESAFEVLEYCKRVTVLERRDGDVLALACRGVSARYKSGLEARREMSGRGSASTTPCSQKGWYDQ
jgi:hypothetical protein